MTSKNPKRHALISSPFYRLSSRKRLAELLFTSPESIDNTLKLSPLYKRKWKSKKKDDCWLNTEPTPNIADDYRPIDIPHPILKTYQSRIANLLGRILPPDYLFSPVKGRSYVDNAVQHIESNAFWMLDIANYFPSCTANNVAWFFGKIMKCSPDVTAILVKITTHNGSLPQGSPCSPILAYYSNLNMWEDISKLVENYDCLISVYADDITLSAKKYVPKKLVWKIKQRIIKQRLHVKTEKEANVINRPASITGVIISNHRSLLPNRQHEALNALRREYLATNDSSKRQKIRNQIAGRIAQKGQIDNSNLR